MLPTIRQAHFWYQRDLVLRQGDIGGRRATRQALSANTDTSFRQMTQRVRVRLPVSSIERLNGHRRDCPRIQATCIDTVTVGIGPRYVERFDATHGAEKVSGNTSIDKSSTCTH